MFDANIAEAQRLELSGLPDEAAAVLQQAAALEPLRPEPHLKLALLHHAQGRCEQAQECLRRAASLTSVDSELLPVLADLHLEWGLIEDAARLYRSLFDIGKRDTALIQKLVGALNKSGGFKSALEVICQAEKVLCPAWGSELAYYRGETLEALKQPVEAAAAYSEVNPESPLYPTAMVRVGDIHFRQCNWYRSIEAYEQALLVHPNYVWACCNIGRSLTALGRPDEAEVYLRRAICADPELADARGFLAEALLEQDKVEEAITAYLQGAQLNEANGQIRLGLGRAYLRYGRSEEAVECFSAALDLSGDYVWPCLQALSGAAAGVGFADSPARAAVMARLNDRFSQILESLGDSAASAGNQGRALTCYQKAVECCPGRASLQFALGKTFAALDKLQEAAACFRRALEYDPGHHDAGRRLRKLAKRLGTEFGEHGRLSGRLETVSHVVQGWAIDRAQPGGSSHVDIHVGSQLYGVVPANRFRADLAGKGREFAERSFLLDICPGLTTYGPMFLSARYSNTGTDLPGSPVRVQLGSKGIKHPSYDPASCSEASAGLLFRTGNTCSSAYPAVAVIISHFNQAQLLDDLFASFVRYNTYEPLEVIVVDHGSTDGSREVCEKWAERMALRVLNEAGEYTFSTANNFGARATSAPLLLFLNNDIVFCQDIIGSLVCIMQDSGVGLTGVRLLDAPGAPGAECATQHLGVALDFDSASHVFSPYEMRYFPQLRPFSSAPWKVPAVTGSLMMCRREEFLSLGGFPEQYFFGYEDVDLCLAVRRRLGKEVVCANNAAAIHHRGCSRFRTNQAFQRRIADNRPVLEARHGYYCRRRHLEDFFDKGIFWTGHPLRIGFAVTEADARTGAGDYFTARELGEYLIREHGCEVMFYEKDSDHWYNLEHLDVLIVMRHDYDLRAVRNAKPGLLTVAWARSWLDKWAAVPWASDYDCFWCSSPKGVEYIDSALGRPAALLPIATNDRLFRARPSCERYSSDYCFTGSNWGPDRDIMAALDPSALPYRFALYGFNWSGVEKFRPYYRGPADYSDLPEIYSSTKVVIDDAVPPTREWGSVNSRVFDAIACGALVVTNGALGSADLFNGLLPVYSSSEELSALLKKYLENEDERSKAVLALRNLVLERHTYSVRAAEAASLLKKTLAKSFRVAIKIGAPNREQALHWGDYHFAMGLKRALERQGHRARVDVLSDWYERPTLGDDAVIVLRGLSEYRPQAHHINIMWNISHPEGVSAEEYERYDHVFVASQRYTEELKKKVKVPLSVLYQCTDPRLFYRDPQSAGDAPEMLFVGNSRRVYREAVREAVEAGAPLHVYGEGWEDLLPPGVLKGEYIPYEELRRHYSSARLVLNDHWPEMRDKGFLSNRLFDAAACQALIVSDDAAGLQDVFRGQVATYSGKKPLCAAAQEALEHSERTAPGRAELAEVVRREHTFDARAVEIVKRIGELHAAKMRG